KKARVNSTGFEIPRCDVTIIGRNACARKNRHATIPRSGAQHLSFRAKIRTVVAVTMNRCIANVRKLRAVIVTAEFNNRATHFVRIFRRAPVDFAEEKSAVLCAQTKAEPVFVVAQFLAGIAAESACAQNPRVAIDLDAHARRGERIRRKRADLSDRRRFTEAAIDENSAGFTNEKLRVEGELARTNRDAVVFAAEIFFDPDFVQPKRVVSVYVAGDVKIVNVILRETLAVRIKRAGKQRCFAKAGEFFQVERQPRIEQAFVNRAAPKTAAKISENFAGVDQLRLYRTGSLRAGVRDQRD